MLLRVLHNLPLIASALLVVFGVFVTAEALTEARQRAAYEQAIAGVEVIAPKGFPTQDQESVDLAMVMFSIDTPVTVDGPAFDPFLADRGLTTGGLILPQKTVTIGPAAFTSWGVLGSTLAHEIEVHVPQSFFKVVATDHLTQWSLSARKSLGRVFPVIRPSPKELFENDGTWSAEREAYMHEIRNAKRFGLTDEELRSIWRVMDYFYPSNDSEDTSHLSASSKTRGDELDPTEINSSEL